MRQTNYKVDKIKDYINENNPKYSELVRHIVVEINGVASSDFFDKNKSQFKGYYSTNIGTMRRKGNIWSKDGNYYVTKQGMSDEHSLYRKPKIDELKDEIKHLKRHLKWEQNRRKDLQDSHWNFKIKIREDREILEQINLLSKTN
mgnify:CR=1 FL=1|tara:strand:+ start:1669 stop:2103 length:435 start_codon:yes stop_codon:yes gene_type:complete